MKPALLALLGLALCGILFLPPWAGATGTVLFAAASLWERLRSTRHQREAEAHLARELEHSRELQKSLAISQTELRSLLDVAPVAILQADPDLRQVYVNDAFLEFFQAPREQVVGMDLRTLRDHCVLPPLLEALAGRKGSYTGPYLPSFSATPRSIDLVAAPLFHADGSVRGAVAIVRDTTATERALAELRQARDRLDEILDTIPSGVYTLRICGDGTMGFDFFSQRAADLVGLRQEDILLDARLAFQSAHPDEAMGLLVGTQKANETLEPYRWEGRFLVHGETRWLHLESRGTRLPDGGSLWSGVVTDITDRRLVEEELRSAKAEAEKASLIKGEFLATMSHEVRTPMNGVLGLLQLTLHEEKDPRQKERLQKALGAGRALLDILNDVLDWSRIESGNLVMEEAEFDLREVLQGVADLFESDIRSRGVRFETDVAPELPVLVRGDSHRLRQILSNLVGNAAKFTSHGRIRMEAFVGEVADGRIELRLAVRDTGIGIPWDHLGRLFQPFQQVDSSTTRRFGGTGLGLAICRQLAERMGGSIAVESELGKGSAFLVSVHLGLVGDWMPPESRSSTVDSCLSIERRRILLVEDNALNQEVARGLLEFSGFDVLSAWHGQECLDILETTEVDLVLMDLHMPVMGGLEAMRKLRFLPNGRKVPVVALTADARPAVVEECLQAGMVSHVSKPFDPAQLLAVLEEQLKSSD